MVKVSIIVPVYNVEQYLSRCLDTITSQSYENIEIVIINDGSTDESPQIMQAYANFDKRIKIINKENGGLSSARNAGLEVVTGDYTMFVDSDDLISTIAVEKLCNTAVPKSADVVIFPHIKGRSDIVNHTLMNNPELKQFETFNAETLPENYIKFIPVSAWSKFYKTKFLKENNITFYENIIYEDVPFWAEVFNCAKTITYEPEPLYFYRECREGQITKQNGKSIFDVIKCYDLLEQTYKKHQHWDKYKHSIQMLMMLDFMKKYYMINQDLKRSLFDAFKNLNKSIDYGYYKSQNLYKFEALTCEQFQKLQELPFEEFENYLKGENHANT